MKDVVAADITIRVNVVRTVAAVAEVEVRRAKSEIFLLVKKYPVGNPTYKTTAAYNATYYYMV